MLDITTKEDREAGAGNQPAAPVQPKLRGIAVLGSQPVHKWLAPFNDPGWLIYACSPDNTPYGLSEAKSVLPRVDEWFEIHVPVFDRSRPYAYLGWLSNIRKVWMRDRVAMSLRAANGAPAFPTAVLYPEREMKARFGPYVFTSTIAFMMAKAIVDIEQAREQGRVDETDGPPMIGLWGILQASKQEYVQQRGGTQEMIWNAVRSGIKVLVAPESGLLEAPPEVF